MCRFFSMRVYVPNCYVSCGLFVSQSMCVALALLKPNNTSHWNRFTWIDTLYVSLYESREQTKNTKRWCWTTRLCFFLHWTRVTHVYTTIIYKFLLFSYHNFIISFHDKIICEQISAELNILKIISYAQFDFIRLENEYEWKICVEWDIIWYQC